MNGVINNEIDSLTKGLNNTVKLEVSSSAEQFIKKNDHEEENDNRSKKLVDQKLQSIFDNLSSKKNIVITDKAIKTYVTDVNRINQLKPNKKEYLEAK